MIVKKTLPAKRDPRGVLTIAEKGEIPFQVKRVYYLAHLQTDLPRGFHAHYELQQLMICVQGSCEVLLDDGFNKETVKLNEGESLLIDKMVWHEMNHFSADCVLSVLASDVYNEADYIRDYEQFKKALKK